MTDQPLRIVHCANFSDKKFGSVYYSTDRKISNGLIRNGHMVHDFSYRDIARNQAPFSMKRLGIRKMNRRLTETVENVRPDLLLLGHSELVENETLHDLRAQYPNMKIAMWWVDWWHNLVKYDRVMSRRMPLLDALFMTTKPDYVRENYAPTREVKKLFFMPNSCDPSMDTGRAFEVETPRHDLLFIGRRTSFRAELIEFLETQTTDINLGLYGQSRETLVTGHHYIDLLSNSRMAINFSRDNEIPLYSSDRQVHLAANGCLTFTPNTPDMKSLFSEEEMVYFSDLEDLREKILYYNTHTDKAREVARAGHARAQRDYEAAVITKNILRAVFV